MALWGLSLVVVAAFVLSIVLSPGPQLQLPGKRNR
ncbi:hypothetical protein BVRB_6g131310 [Beta vulgaris subsp. vulgaris]|nr:hypothetical protein BVRB_6g131310 [Beta vulgaris subsp. vulgaris]